MKNSQLQLKGLDCADCAAHLESDIHKIAGVVSAKIDFINARLIVEYDERQVSLVQINNLINKAGYAIVQNEEIAARTLSAFWQKHQMLILTTISGLFAISGSVLSYFQASRIITIPVLLLAVICGGFPIAKKGWQEVRNLRLGMNFLMSIAVIGALVIGEWSEAAIVIFLFALAQLLESYTVARARQSIRSLMQLAPDSALIKTETGQRSIPVDKINIGDVIIIKPGERIALDGVVISGDSMVNQAPITGESMPVAKRIGDLSYAGTINERGTLEVRVTTPATDSTIARIIRLVEQAQAQKAPTQTVVEKFSRYYTPIVVACAVLLATIPPVFFQQPVAEWLYRSLVLLVISCPCALVISTPVTIVSGLTNAARNGILLKGGAYLENFSKVQALAFDKTGTLTFGKPMVRQIIPFNNHRKEDVLQIAASLESRSEHSLAQAIVEHARANQIVLLPIDCFESITGKGVRATVNGELYHLGNHRLFEEHGWCEPEIHRHLSQIENQQHTAVILGNSSSILGMIAIADAVRDNAARAIQQLHRSGIRKMVLLTGDNEHTAQAIASEIGIDEYQAELLPQDKVMIIKRLLQQYRSVAMVGDGINDAPALAAATMGISMGRSGTDTALETADIALMQDDLTRLSYLMQLSKKTMRIIKQNIFLALFLKGIFVMLAIPGLATLWMAVFADMGASLMVVLNGMRALKS